MYRSNCITLVLFVSFPVLVVYSTKTDECLKEGILSKEKLTSLSRTIIPEMNKKGKGEAGRIGVIGGSVEYTGAPYFGAITSLKIGADLVYVITTEQSAPVIKSYSPDLIVYPYLNRKFTSKIDQLLQKMDVVVIGPGLGRDEDQIKLILDIMQTCKILKKALVIDADGLYALATNLTVLRDYPKPGAILTPNIREATRLMESIMNTNNSTQWYNFWGDKVSVLVKGYEDTCYSGVSKFSWSLLGGGSDRRVAGQGDILAGALGTLYHWALKSNLCETEQSIQLSQSVAIYAAARFTRTCNSHAYSENGRNMIASDMLKRIHSAFDEVFLA